MRARQVWEFARGPGVGRVGGLLIVGAGLAALALCDAPSSARWSPPQREVVIKEVSNGYLLELRQTNNPYPAVLAVEHTTANAALRARALLEQRFPEPRWGGSR